MALVTGFIATGVRAAEYSKAETELLNAMTGVWSDGNLVEFIVRLNTPEKALVINGGKVPVTITKITGATVTIAHSGNQVMYLELRPFNNNSALIRIVDDIGKKEGDYADVYYARPLGFDDLLMLDRK